MTRKLRGIIYKPELDISNTKSSLKFLLFLQGNSINQVAPRGFRHSDEQINSVMNKLPEVKDVGIGQAPIGAEEQLRKLRQKLAGHRVFGKLRGKFEDFSPEDFLHDKKDRPLCPSKVQERFAKWIADRKVMFQLLATLGRDSQTVAYEELLKALCEDHVITGEDIPLEQTEKGVLVMVDPEKTILLVRWLYTSTPEDGKKWVAEGKLPPDRGMCGSLTPQLVETFPDLVEEFKNPLNRILEFPLEKIHPHLEKARERFRQKMCADDVKWICIDPGRTHYWRGCRAVALFLHGKDQKGALSFFTREEQKSISTWKFDYPKITRRKMGVSWGSSPNFWIGLHPEEEHTKWRRRWPSFASRGCANNLGAVIVDKEMLGETSFNKDENSLPPYSPLNYAMYPNMCPANILKARVVIGFPFSEDL